MPTDMESVNSTNCILASNILVVKPTESNIGITKGVDRNYLRRQGMVHAIDGYIEATFGPHPVQNGEIEILQALKLFFRRWNMGLSKTKAALDTAYSLGKGCNFSRRIVVWAAQWKEHEEIVLSRRGKHAKARNVLSDNDVYNDIWGWILEKHKYTITPIILQRHVNNVVLPSMGIARSISEATARRWLGALGWVHSKVKKGLYYDGHERPDVVEYRKEFLDRMEQLERQMVIVDRNDHTKVVIPVLEHGERPLMFYTHDESIFYANEGESVLWHPDGQLPLCKKGQG